MAARPIIFVSCGQVTDAEKKLGAKICDLVRDLTDYDPYFAENQSSLEGVSQNILGAMNRSAGMIAVLHPRGEVLGLLGSKHVRASVWIEQEIAIASFLTQVEGRNLPILIYIHKSIKREGLRDQLMLNPRSFGSEKEILEDLQVTLPTWAVSASATDSAELTIDYEKGLSSSAHHNYRLLVRLKNAATTAIESYHLDVFFPTDLLPEDQIRPLEIRSTAAGSLFRVSTAEH